MNDKVIIYQVFTRLFGNRNLSRKENGTVAENGCGKMADFTPEVLKDIQKMGISHVWYTGIIRHATQTLPALYSSTIFWYLSLNAVRVLFLARIFASSSSTTLRRSSTMRCG